MNQKVDFLIRYEHKIRELESVMLLKLELERRGYTVGLVCNYEHRHDYEPKVLIVPAGYYTEHFMYEMCKYSIRMGHRTKRILRVGRKRHQTY